MARAIDAEKFMELLKEQYLHHKSMGHNQMAKAWQGAMQLLHDMPTLTPPNEPLTQADLDGMDYDKVWIDYEDGTGEWALVCKGYIYSIDTLEGAGLDFVDYMRGEKLEPHGYKVYRRPPEGEEDT